jgi:DNA-binding transcriptional LysR family regulator
LPDRALGSVSRAAEALYVSQPAITLQLQALERELGVKLFDRVGRRLTPSREGQVLYELAKPLVEGIDGSMRSSATRSRASMRANSTSPRAARPSSICCPASSKPSASGGPTCA